MASHPIATADRWAAGYDLAVDDVTRLVGEEGLRLEGAAVLDLTEDDPALALGLAVRAGARVSAFGEQGYDVEGLRASAAERIGLKEFPEGLHYSHRNAAEIPTPDDRFDLAMSWDGLQHSRRPVSLLAEVRRVLKPQAPLLLRVDPLWVPTGSDAQDPWRADGFGLDELQRCLLAARFTIVRAAVRGSDVRLTGELGRYPLSRVAVAGVTLLALPED